VISDVKYYNGDVRDYIGDESFRDYNDDE